MVKITACIISGMNLEELLWKYSFPILQKLMMGF